MSREVLDLHGGGVAAPAGWGVRGLRGVRPPHRLRHRLSRSFSLWSQTRASGCADGRVCAGTEAGAVSPPIDRPVCDAPVRPLWAFSCGVVFLINSYWFLVIEGNQSPCVLFIANAFPGLRYFAV